ALKLGQAFGSALRAGNTVMTSRDENPASRMMNRCIISGLLSVGINVQDLRSIPLPLARYAVRGGANGGVHTRLSPGDRASLLIELYDEMGINLSTVLERKIEGIFFREDFRRTTIDEVGSLDFPARAIEGYNIGFLEALKPQALEKAGFRAVVDYAYGSSAAILPRLFGALNVEMITLNAYFDPKKARQFADDRHRHLGQIADIVRTVNANFGLLLDNDGETFALVDDLGRIVDGTRLLALLTLLIARGKPGARIAMPVMVPSAIESIAKAHGAKVIYTRSDRRALRTLGNEVDFAGGAHDEVLFPEFQPAFDGLYGAAKTMELIAAEGRPLSELVDLLPDWHIARDSVPCPWDRKGAVMRTLYDEFESRDLELTDGLRVRRDGGWVLVLPDASEASVKLYAEGSTDAVASRYLKEVQHRIEALVGA
ncbi:MAG TPA: hypothetical protein VME66_05620, partial [Candidatus Acidoferrales bacterium]|nr:hypothetical protein [Candidatus Acidoferrales bacterium]